MLVREIMSSSVKTVTPDTPLHEVVSLMCLYRYSGLPVVEDHRLVGIIAEKDVLHRLFPRLEDLMSSMGNIDMDGMLDTYKDVVHLKVSDLMVSKVISIPADVHVLKAASIMAGNRFRRIPVTDGNKLLGMLSLGDVHKAIFHRNLSGCLTAA